LVRSQALEGAVLLVIHDGLGAGVIKTELQLHAFPVGIHDLGAGAFASCCEEKAGSWQLAAGSNKKINEKIEKKAWDSFLLCCRLQAVGFFIFTPSPLLP
jgi:hypothetical protein